MPNLPFLQVSVNGILHCKHGEHRELFPDIFTRDIERLLSRDGDIGFMTLQGSQVILGLKYGGPDELFSVYGSCCPKPPAWREQRLLHN